MLVYAQNVAARIMNVLQSTLMHGATGEASLAEISRANGGLVRESVQSWAAKEHDRVALLAENGDAISYGRLLHQMDAIRHALNERGFGRGDRVAIVHPSDARSVVLSLSVSSGMTVIPLNPASTEEQIERELLGRQADTVLQVAGTPECPRIAARKLGLPIVDMHWDGPSMDSGFTLDGGRGAPARLPGLAGEDDIALVLASSGTTSDSRIVPIRHHAFAIRAKRGARKYTETDRGLTMVPVYLSTGIMNAAGSLANGASSIIASTLNTETYFQIFETLQPTWLQASPALLKGILSEIHHNNRDVRHGQIRFIRPASGRISREDSDALEGIFGCAVIEAYGTTETGKIACNPFPPERRIPGTVGLPLDCDIAIRGEEGQFLPAGEQGEIVIRRDHVFDGYENDLAETEAAFIDGWYRTGDLGFLDEDGT